MASLTPKDVDMIYQDGNLAKAARIEANKFLTQALDKAKVPQTIENNWLAEGYQSVLNRNSIDSNKHCECKNTSGKVQTYNFELNSFYATLGLNIFSVLLVLFIVSLLLYTITH